MVDGHSWLFEKGDDTAAIWGEGDQVLWSAGEALLLTGAIGGGKTTVAQNLLLRRAGVLEDDLLGHPVHAATSGCVLYLAIDRPQQARRSMRRMVTEPEHGDLLRRRLKVVTAPYPVDLRRDPEELVTLARGVGAHTVFIDSLKDLLPGLKEDEGGTTLTRSIAHCLAAEIEVVGLHHARKQSAKTLADVYGSTWITAGAGSVLLLDGEAVSGEPVSMKQVKQPFGRVAPMKIVFEMSTGAVHTTTAGSDNRDLARELVAYAQTTATFSVRDAAHHINGTTDRAGREKTRRALDQLVRSGQLHHGPRAGRATTYRLVP